MSSSGNHKQDQLSQLSVDYLKSRPKSERSSIGQFLTPRMLREELVNQINLKPGMRVLDPGVGTGEFLLTCLEKEKDLRVEGWDIDALALEVAGRLVPSAALMNQSALDQPWNEEFDVVIGNPPYFEMRNLSTDLRRRYREVIRGRPNIFSLFFAAGLGALKPGGVLGFVVPPSMNNGAFFSKLREFISSKAEIEFMKVFTDTSLFQDVQTAVQLLVIRKGNVGTNFQVDLGSLSQSTEKRVIFSENPSLLRNEFQNRSTLFQLGYEAVTGTIVWNEHKNELRSNRQDGAVPLLWAHNITSEKEIVLDESHLKKPQYVITHKKESGPAIIVNRITGSVGQGNLRCAIVPENFEFVGENHVNVIRARKDVNPLVSWEELLELLRKPGINRRIQLLTGNTQISCIELTYFLPFDSEEKATSNQKTETLF